MNKINYFYASVSEEQLPLTENPRPIPVVNLITMRNQRTFSIMLASNFILDAFAIEFEYEILLNNTIITPRSKFPHDLENYKMDKEYSVSMVSLFTTGYSPKSQRLDFEIKLYKNNDFIDSKITTLYLKGE